MKETKEMTNQQFNEKSTLLNDELKWVVWWGEYAVVPKSNDMQEFIKVLDKRIYFNDGTSSEVFESNDAAIIEATKIINNLK
tara:strand:+ start:104 stop:349 length:246 start_codon:yes stop_codon:yes gene_type:complete